MRTASVVTLLILAGACGDKDGVSDKTDDSSTTDDSTPNTDDSEVVIESPLALGIWLASVSELGTDSCGAGYAVGDTTEFTAGINEEDTVVFDGVVEVTFDEADPGAFTAFGLKQATLEGLDCAYADAITLSGRYEDPKTIVAMNRTDAYEFSGTECDTAPYGGTPCAIDFKQTAVWQRDGASP